MLVERIIIEKRPLEIDDNAKTVRFFLLPELGADMPLNPGIEMANEHVDLPTEHWKLVVLGSATLQKKYLVRADDMGLFSELVDMQNNLVSDFIKNDVEHFKITSYKTIVAEATAATIKKIKELPWHRRLLKVF